MAESLADATLVQTPLTRAPPLALGAALLACVGGVTLAAVLDAPLPDLRRRLLAARCERYGAELVALTQCPACEETIEVVLEADAVLTAFAAAPSAVTVTLADGAEITATVPSVRDVLDAARVPPDDAASLLLARASETVLDADGAARVEAALEAADPLAAGVALRCPECATEWAAELDPCAYVVAELADAQSRVLDDIHMLATAYGWDEATIAALPAWRRARYRERIER